MLVPIDMGVCRLSRVRVSLAARLGRRNTSKTPCPSTLRQYPPSCLNMASPKHIDPSTIPFTPIPPPPNPNAICRISFLLNGMMRTNRRVFVDQKQDEMIDVPAWGFLIEKETEDGVHMIVWDLGCRKVRRLKGRSGRGFGEYSRKTMSPTCFSQFTLII